MVRKRKVKRIMNRKMDDLMAKVATEFLEGVRVGEDHFQDDVRRGQKLGKRS